MRRRELVHRAVKKVSRQDPAAFVLGIKPQIFELLESCSANDIRLARRLSEELDQYYWDYYSSLEYQRSQVAEKLKEALAENTLQGAFVFEKWQRVVRVKYNNTPLSAKGSVIDIGQRFNIGNIDKERFPTFPCLYIAASKHTALNEVLGQAPDAKTGLTQYSNYLANEGSISIFSLSGKIESVFDLTTKDSLEDFLNIIKGFQIPEHVFKMCRELQKYLDLSSPTLVRTTSELYSTFNDPDWRVYPRQVGMPSNSQVFGRLVKGAGIEGILYLSKITGEQCLAVFPENFESSTSYIKCDHELSETVKISELNAETWKSCI